MIDLHTHILWGIDDGSKSVDMSSVMLDIAEENGTKVIFATPHVIEFINKPKWELIVEKSKQMQQIANNKNLNIEILPGAEIQMNWDLLPEIGVQGSYCLNGSRYALIELPVLEIPEYADEFFYELLLKGIVPIIAHPERNQVIMNNLTKLLEWMRNGVLLQCNSGSVTGAFGNKVRENVEILLKNRLITFIGSDAHRDKRRDTNLIGAKKIMMDLVGKDYCEEIFYRNPSYILKNELVEVNVPDKILSMNKNSNIWNKLMSFISSTRRSI